MRRAIARGHAFSRGAAGGCTLRHAPGNAGPNAPAHENLYTVTVTLALANPHRDGYPHPYARSRIAAHIAHRRDGDGIRARR